MRLWLLNKENIRNVIGFVDRINKYCFWLCCGALSLIAGFDLLSLVNLYSPTLIDQGQVGISTTIRFEALTGERPSSHLEMHNEGTTAIFYSWQQLPRRNSFPNLRTQTKSRHFYFNSSSGTHTNKFRHLLPHPLCHTLFSNVSACRDLLPVLSLSFCFPFASPPIQVWFFQVTPSV